MAFPVEEVPDDANLFNRIHQHHFVEGKVSSAAFNQGRRLFMAVCEAETPTTLANNSEQGLEPESEVTSNGTLPYAARIRTNIMGIMVDRTTRQQVLNDIDRFIAAQTPHQIVTVNVDFINIAEREPSFIELLNRAALTLTDDGSGCQKSCDGKQDHAVHNTF